MKADTAEAARSDRLRKLVETRFPSWGRFSKLEKASAIAAHRWKNFFYGKQNATDEMIRYWCIQYPDDADQLLSGIFVPSQDDFPFSAPIPKPSQCTTVVDRLIWVISELAGGADASVFQFLEERSGRQIPASEWARVMMRMAEPSAAMLSQICRVRPHFTEWVVVGMVTATMQVNPSDKDSIERWKKNEAELINAIDVGLLTNADQSNDNKAG